MIIVRQMDQTGDSTYEFGTPGKAVTFARQRMKETGMWSRTDTQLFTTPDQLTEESLGDSQELILTEAVIGG